MMYQLDLRFNYLDVFLHERFVLFKFLVKDKPVHCTLSLLLSYLFRLTYLVSLQLIDVSLMA